MAEKKAEKTVKEKPEKKEKKEAAPKKEEKQTKEAKPKEEVPKKAVEKAEAKVEKKVEEKVKEPAKEKAEAPAPKSKSKSFQVPKSRCVSCGAYIAVGDGSVTFPCPECGEGSGRCANCRALGRQYKCTCGFVGP